MAQFSIIIPVYNRPDEMREMLESLVQQSVKDFELIVVEDGSTDSSQHLIAEFQDHFPINYFYKKNTGPGDSRNFGMSKAKGEYLLFFDSDCVLPSDYFENLRKGLKELKPDAFGGPDAAHDSFSTMQKAINYAMTSFFTTGGIRGGKKQLDRYQPRSFNMGMSRDVYKRVGGFSDVHPGEDPDLSFRIMNAGFKVSLIPEAKVFHKRRIDFRKFVRQVYKFGVVRVILNKWHPGTGKLVYWFPALFMITLTLALIGGLLVDWKFVLPFLTYAILLFCDAVISAGLLVALLAIPAAFVQLCGYGFGFIKSFFKLNVFGLEERKAFPSFFFDKNKP